jgi:hypothetical protein
MIYNILLWGFRITIHDPGGYGMVNTDIKVENLNLILINYLLF